MTVIPLPLFIIAWIKVGAKRQMDIAKIREMNFCVPPPAWPLNIAIAAPQIPMIPKTFGIGPVSSMAKLLRNLVQGQSTETVPDNPAVEISLAKAVEVRPVRQAVRQVVRRAVP